MFTKEVIELAKPCVEAIKKISKAKGKEWKWKPEVGDFFLFSKDKGMCVEPKEKRGVVNILYIIEEVVPILHWEKLEKIMNSLGCRSTLNSIYIIVDFKLYSGKNSVMKMNYIVCPYIRQDKKQ